MKEIVIDAKRENLPILFDFLTDSLSPYSKDKRTIRKVKLCAEEAFMNIASYAYNPDTGPAKVSIDTLGSPYPIKIEMVFTDKGKPFNPLTIAPPDIESGLEDRKIGGLGIFLIRKEMDEILYEYRDGENVLTMKKTI